MVAYFLAHDEQIRGLMDSESVSENNQNGNTGCLLWWFLNESLHYGTLSQGLTDWRIMPPVNQTGRA